jgi:hypothetical protein
MQKKVIPLLFPILSFPFISPFQPVWCLLITNVQMILIPTWLLTNIAFESQYPLIFSFSTLTTFTKSKLVHKGPFKLH